MRQSPRFSIIIPARNEARFLAGCLESIRVAAMSFPMQVEVIVVLNCCTDETEEIARSWGARSVIETARNLAAIRNSGARLAAGQVLVTIDADSRMSPGTLVAIDRALASRKTGRRDVYPARPLLSRHPLHAPVAAHGSPDFSSFRRAVLVPHGGL